MWVQPPRSNSEPATLYIQETVTIGGSDVDSQTECNDADIEQAPLRSSSLSSLLPPVSSSKLMAASLHDAAPAFSKSAFHSTDNFPAAGIQCAAGSSVPLRQSSSQPTIFRGESEAETAFKPSVGVEFTHREQLHIFLMALESPQLRSNCLEIMRQNSIAHNHQLLAKLMKACADTAGPCRSVLVQFANCGRVCFHEPFGRLVDLITCGLRRSSQPHLLIGQLCCLAGRLCIRPDNRVPRFEDIADVAQHLPILTHAAYLLRHEASEARIDEEALRELLRNIFTHPFLTDLSLIYAGRSQALQLPKLVIAEGLITTAFVIATQPGRETFLRDLLEYFKGLRGTLNAENRMMLDQQTAGLLLGATVAPPDVVSSEDANMVRSEHIASICYELLVDDQCSPDVASAVNQLQQHLYLRTNCTST
ncbi:hypothetical protein THASP1DRAFT_27169 [Thamnocephalis sphaerospora]|uniref:Uncharacterized protein n=1 Tax=Thamnocephalis sphaerospora TaxID=78915 RepID=A0A4V1IXH4_9FUNG|nr:hypothetical protein THASP1DRAFT_27169 [Thamnocephalis sphaerospora]|eukprot:RKP11069.1 hypothetical protein THASP1DRAFT_27169 [Thamnocephalis sphaerospora]